MNATPLSPAADSGLERRVWRQLSAAIRTFRLIEAGDHLLLGLSGGKDSYVLLRLLGALRRRRPGWFQLTAFHVALEGVGYKASSETMKRWAEEEDIPLYIEQSVLEPDRDGRRSPCFLCSWRRRKLLFNAAQRMGCQKIVLGHHQDDIIRTAVMNLIFTGSFSTMPARLAMRKFPVTIIRPLCMLSEDDVAAWAAQQGYMGNTGQPCPHAALSHRTSVAEVTGAMQALSPDYRRHVWHALLKAGQLVDDSSPVSAEASTSASRLSVREQGRPS